MNDSPNIALAFVALSLLLTACGHHDQPKEPSADEKLRNALVGTWTRNNDGSGYTSLAADGTFSAQFNTTNTQHMKVWAYAGTWTAAGGFCIVTLTNSRAWGTTNREAEGNTDRLRIITIDQNHLVWEADGETNSLVREK